LPPSRRLPNRSGGSDLFAHSFEGKRWWGRKEQNNKIPKIFPPYQVSACGGLKWGARKRFKKNEGESLGVLYSAERSRRWGVRSEIRIRIFFEKGSYFVQEGQVCKQKCRIAPFGRFFVF